MSAHPSLFDCETCECVDGVRQRGQPWTILYEDEHTTEDTMECPRYHVDRDALHLFNLKDACASMGGLPDEGGINQQDNRTVEAFRAIESRQLFWRKQKTPQAKEQK